LQKTTSRNYKECGREDKALRELTKITKENEGKLPPPASSAPAPAIDHRQLQDGRLGSDTVAILAAGSLDLEPQPAGLAYSLKAVPMV
jgi:hypothetical protein